MCMRAGGWERPGHPHTHTHTIHTPSGTHTDRLTDRQTDRQTDKQTHVGDHGIHCMHENVKGM